VTIQIQTAATQTSLLLLICTPASKNQNRNRPLNTASHSFYVSPHSPIKTPLRLCTLYHCIHPLAIQLLLLFIIDRSNILAEIIVALDFLHNVLHFLDLLLPLLSVHLRLAVEQFHVGLAVRAAEAVPQRRELAIVVVEVEVVHGVAGGAVDNGGVRDVFTVVR